LFVVLHDELTVVSKSNLSTSWISQLIVSAGREDWGLGVGEDEVDDIAGFTLLYGHEVGVWSLNGSSKFVSLGKVNLVDTNKIRLLSVRPRLGC
jgi:hypothetical protein